MSFQLRFGGHTKVASGSVASNKLFKFVVEPFLDWYCDKKHIDAYVQMMLSALGNILTATCLSAHQHCWRDAEVIGTCNKITDVLQGKQTPHRSLGMVGFDHLNKG